ncbi:hypothetical protein ABTX60_29050 [Streptomyces sp. NPDC126510]|uniref:hypothetical protein n=1 Tax=Streptomyces sp. NPDC126510 TaxID=3155317 RepID=UPI003323B838
MTSGAQAAPHRPGRGPPGRFGLPHQGLHGVDELVHLADLPVVHAVYRQAVLGLLTG